MATAHDRQKMNPVVPIQICPTAKSLSCKTVLALHDTH
jgi:hypothetical protein